MVVGVLSVIVKEATLEQKRWGPLSLGRLFPYVRVKVGDKVAKTKVCKAKGEFSWEETLQFEVTPQTKPRLYADVINGQESAHVVVAQLIVDFRRLAFKTRSISMWFPVYRFSKKVKMQVGKLHLTIQFDPDPNYTGNFLFAIDEEDELSMGVDNTADIDSLRSLHLWEMTPSELFGTSRILSLTAPPGGLVPAPDDDETTVGNGSEWGDDQTTWDEMTEAEDPAGASMPTSPGSGGNILAACGPEPTLGSAHHTSILAAIAALGPTQATSFPHAGLLTPASGAGPAAGSTSTSLGSPAGSPDGSEVKASGADGASRAGAQVEGGGYGGVGAQVPATFPGQQAKSLLDMLGMERKAITAAAAAARDKDKDTVSEAAAALTETYTGRFPHKSAKSLLTEMSEYTGVKSIEESVRSGRIMLMSERNGALEALHREHQTEIKALRDRYEALLRIKDKEIAELRGRLEAMYMTRTARQLVEIDLAPAGTDPNYDLLEEDEAKRLPIIALSITTPPDGRSSLDAKAVMVEDDESNDDTTTGGSSSREVSVAKKTRRGVKVKKVRGRRPRRPAIEGEDVQDVFNGADDDMVESDHVEEEDMMDDGEDEWMADNTTPPPSVLRSSLLELLGKPKQRPLQEPADDELSAWSEGGQLRSLLEDDVFKRKPLRKKTVTPAAERRAVEEEDVFEGADAADEESGVGELRMTSLLEDEIFRKVSTSKKADGATAAERGLGIEEVGVDEDAATEAFQTRSLLEHHMLRDQRKKKKQTQGEDADADAGGAAEDELSVRTMSLLEDEVFKRKGRGLDGAGDAEPDTVLSIAETSLLEDEVFKTKTTRLPSTDKKSKEAWRAPGGDGELEVVEDANGVLTIRATSLLDDDVFKKKRKEEGSHGEAESRAEEQLEEVFSDEGGGENVDGLSVRSTSLLEDDVFQQRGAWGTEATNGPGPQHLRMTSLLDDDMFKRKPQRPKKAAVVSPAPGVFVITEGAESADGDAEADGGKEHEVSGGEGVGASAKSVSRARSGGRGMLSASLDRGLSSKRTPLGGAGPDPHAVAAAAARPTIEPQAALNAAGAGALTARKRSARFETLPIHSIRRSFDRIRQSIDLSQKADADSAKLNQFLGPTIIVSDVFAPHDDTAAAPTAPSDECMGADMEPDLLDVVM